MKELSDKNLLRKKRRGCAVFTPTIGFVCTISDNDSDMDMKISMGCMYVRSVVNVSRSYNL